MDFFAIGFGIRTFSSENQVIEVFYPLTIYMDDNNRDIVSSIIRISRGLGWSDSNNVMGIYDIGVFKGLSQHIDIVLDSMLGCKNLVITILTKPINPRNVEEAYLYLTLYSQEKIPVDDSVKEFCYRVLPEVFLTSEGIIAPCDIDGRIILARVNGSFLKIHDKVSKPLLQNYLPNTKSKGSYLGEGFFI